MLEEAVVEVGTSFGETCHALVESFVRRLNGDEDELGVIDHLVERTEADRALLQEGLN